MTLISVHRACRLTAIRIVFLFIVLSLSQACPTRASDGEDSPGANFSAAMIAVQDATDTRLGELKAAGIDTIVFPLTSPTDEAKQTIRTAADRVNNAKLSLAYWVEVARSPELAKRHPQWMASLQTHDEWRRFFPNAPLPKANEVAKTYPWVPILSREPFTAQRERVAGLLADLPDAELVFLNDLQGAPSACGCGNPLCRWTSDYGKRRTTVPLGDDAAALFISSIKKTAPRSEVIPVWTTECEQHDGHPDGLCAGVGCFKGICWKAYMRQLMPVAAISKRIAVLATYKQFQRDIEHYGPDEASWVRFVIKTFETMPPKHSGKAIPASRIVAIVQGWDVTAEEVDAQKKAAKQAGAHSCVVAFEKIEQSWSPKVVDWK